MRFIECSLMAGFLLFSLHACDSSNSGEYSLYDKDPEPPSLMPDAIFDGSIFPGGVRITDVTPTSAIAAIDTLESTIALSILENKNQVWVEVQKHTGLARGSGQMVHLEIKGLKADTAYSILALDSTGAKRSRVTRFLTALAPDKARILRFGATSCLGGYAFPWPNLTRASEANLDFMIFAGDTVYADNSDGLEAYRGAWKDAFAAEGLANVSSSTSMISTWDDHEIYNDWTWDRYDNVERFEAAKRAYFEAMPWRGEKLYRKLSWGKTLDILVLDSRGERRDGNYISLEQMEWLKSSLLTSEARFKLIVNSVPITDMTTLLGGLLEGDRWQGFPDQRTELLGFIENHQINGTFFVAGDFHYSHIAKVSIPGDVGDSLWEVLAGPAGSGINPLMLTEPQLDDQFSLFVPIHNYTYFEANPAKGTVRVQYIGDDGSLLGEQTLQF